MGVTDRQLDKLYTSAPGEFIAARDALVAELKKAGDKEGAAEVKALRKPTLVAWAANQAARKDAAAVTELVKAGQALVRAQQKMLEGTGRPADLKRASERRRQAVADLVTKAAKTLASPKGGGAKASDAHIDALTATFEAASIDEDAGDLLRAGRLTAELKPAAGLGEAIGFAAADEDDEAADATPSSGGGRRSDRRAARAVRRGGHDRRSAARDSGAASTTSARAEARARAKAADEATEQARRAAAEMARAREAVERAEQQLAEARERYEKAQTRARQAQTNAARAVEDARAAVTGLGAMLEATRPD